MAAWLAYLKSCLLLPKDPGVDPSPEELAMRLQLRLQRLQAMREAGARLIARDRLGRDVFLRGAPEGLKVVRHAAWRADLYDLISAYGIVRARTEPSIHVIARRPVMTLDEAIHRLERMIGAQLEWTALEAFLPETQDARIPQVGARVELRRDAGAGAAGQGHAGAGRRLRAALCEGGMREHSDDALRAVEATLFAADGADERGRDRAACRRRRRRARRAGRAAGHYAGRGVELVERGGRWHFQTAADLAYILRREREESRRLAAPRSRRWRSSPITSRSAAPRSRRSAACRSPGARSTC